MPVRVPNGNRIVMKLEHLTKYNPTGSLYDRVYPFLFDCYEKRGLLRSRETPVIEASVGNAGAAFAHAALSAGYHNYTVILPADVYPARIDQILDLGARLIRSPDQVSEPGPKLLLSPRKRSVKGYYDLMGEILAQDAQGKGRIGKDPRRLVPIAKVRKSFSKPYEQLVTETLTNMEQMDLAPRMDYFIFGVGSGNTISECGRWMKRVSAQRTTVVCCEYDAHPCLKRLLAGSASTAQGRCPYGVDHETLYGIPLRRMSLSTDVIDEVVLLSDEDRETGRHIANEGWSLYAGRPTGLLVHAAMRLAEHVHDRNIFTIVFDSTAKYADEYKPLHDIDFSTGKAVGELAPESHSSSLPESSLQCAAKCPLSRSGDRDWGVPVSDEPLSALVGV